MFHRRSAVPAAEQRSTEILASVRSAFAEKGFDGASMQDLARAAGMSVGNFYRYFPSKSAIVAALITHDLREIEQDFAAILVSPAPLEALRHLLHRRIPEHQNCNDGKLWAEISAAAQRKPEVGLACSRMETDTLAYLTRVFAAETGLTPDDARDRFGTHAAFIIVLFKSASMIAPGDPRLYRDLTAMILRNIDQTLDEISAHRPSASRPPAFTPKVIP